LFLKSPMTVCVGWSIVGWTRLSNSGWREFCNEAFDCKKCFIHCFFCAMRWREQELNLVVWTHMSGHGDPRGDVNNINQQYHYSMTNIGCWRWKS
jgi:hypothetical protein